MSEKIKNIFLTGASGFIGCNIARKLVLEGYNVHVLVRKSSNLLGIKDLPVKIFYGDLNDKHSIESAMKGCNICIHTAAVYSFWEKNKDIFFKTNVEGTKNVLEVARNLNIEKIIYTSSESTVKLLNNFNDGYDAYNNSYNSYNNYNPDYSKLNDINDVYGDYKKTKILSEIEVNKYIQQGLPIVIIAPTTPIGSWDIKPTPTGKIVLDFLRGKMPAYINTGLNIIDVEDVALAHILAIKKGVIGKKYIAGNKNLTLKQIFEILSSITKIKSPSIQIPFWLALGIGYIDELISAKILKKQPNIPVCAVKSASKFRFFNCIESVKELGLTLNPIENAFEKSVKWFKDYGYV